MSRVLVLCCLVVLYPTGAVQCAQVYETEHSNPRSWFPVVAQPRHHSEETENVFVKSVCAAKSDLAEESPDALDVKLVCDTWSPSAKLAVMYSDLCWAQNLSKRP